MAEHCYGSPVASSTHEIDFWAVKGVQPTTMPPRTYDAAARNQIRQRMSPPNLESGTEIARSTGITSQTLYN